MPRPFPDPDKELDALKAFLTKGGETTIDVVEKFASPNQVEASLQKPGVVTFDITASRLLERIGDDDTQRVLLDLGIGDLKVANDFFVELFLNVKDATASTSAEDHGFETGFGFFCEPGQSAPEMACPVGSDAETRRQFDVTATLKQLAGPNDAITATLVLLPLSDKTEGDRALSVKTAELSLVKSTVKIAS
jgi:hypothetical protein